MKAIQLYEALPITSRSSWRLVEVERALRAHEDGRFWESSALAESLGRIGRIAGCLETRASAIVARGCGATFRVETPKGFEEDVLAVTMTTDLERFWWESVPDWAVKSVMRDYVMMGIAYGRVDWDTVDEKWIPRLKPWSLQHLTWDDSRHRYLVNTRQGQVAIEPDDPNWYLFEPNGPRSWMYGAVRALGDMALYRNDAFRDWARFCERHGLPILAIEEPEEASKKDKDKFAGKVARVGSGGILRLPKRADDEKGGYDIKFVEPKNAQAWQTFKEFLGSLTDEMTIRIKGNNLTTSVDGGSFAAANVHAQVDSMILANDTNGFTTFARYQVIMPWGALNYEGFRKDLAPWAIYDATPPQDITKKAAAASSIATALSTLLKDGVRVDTAGTLAEYGIKVLPPDESLDDKGPPGQIFKYHLDYGILTINEIREALGKEPIPGGDVRPTLAAGESPVIDGPAGELLCALDRAKRLRTRTLSSLKSIPVSITEGFQHVDDLTDANVKPVSSEIKPDLDALLGLIKRHSTREGLQRAIEHTYASMHPEQMAKVLERAFILASLSGMYSVLREV